MTFHSIACSGGNTLRVPLLALSVILMFLFHGCSMKNPDTTSAFPSTLAKKIDIDVAFLEQDPDLCASSSLDMILHYYRNLGDIKSIPERTWLDRFLLLPERKGTLQLDLVSTTRQTELIPYVLEGNASALFYELDAGNPVIVLVNLGLSWIPQWHYAVVKGYDWKEKTFYWHSGTNKNEAIPFSKFKFKHTYSDYWMLVPVPKNRIPVSAEPENFLRALIDFERVHGYRKTLSAYAQAHQHWPGIPSITIAYANALYQSEMYHKARTLYRDALGQSNSVIAMNNLALAELHLGDSEKAEEIILKALESETMHKAALEDTLKEIRDSQSNRK